jgi:general secretion pathway protein C
MVKLGRRDTLKKVGVALRLILILLVSALLLRFLFEAVAGELTGSDELENIQRAASEAATKVTDQGKTEGEALSSAPVAPDLRPVVTRNVFGPFTTRQAPATPATTVKPAPVIPLDLIGTFIADNTAPYAIIEDRNKKSQEIFMKGESIFGSAKLITINSDSVVIDRNGQQETLTIDLIGKRGGEGGGTASGGENEFVVSEADIDQALNNLPLLLTQARAVPYFKDGQAVGLRMFAIRSGSLFEKIGIRNGDILKGINGSSLGDLSQAMKLFERLKSERNLNLTLERDRQEREFRYSIR